MNQGASEWLDRLIADARAADGQPPFSDQSLIDVRSGSRRLLAISDVAAAIVSDTEAELVVHPDSRGRGHGSALVSTILRSAEPGFLVWAHGDHPAARALASRNGFEPVRRLLQLRVHLGELSSGSDGSMETQPMSNAGEVSMPQQATYSIRSFVDSDADEWLALNARAFANHPEQGSVTREDLDATMAEPWFDASAFLVMRDGPTMIGYCWLKIEPSSALGNEPGELYVVGVDPDHQGRGIGRALVLAGLAELERRGIRESSLYVEADNTPALKLYQAMGYSEYSVDIQYALTRFTSR